MLMKLATHFDRVLGIDRDAGMREAAGRAVAGYTNASVTAEQLADLRGEFDLITMVAVLHHLDAKSALVEARRLLAPGGRLIVVGLAQPESRLDWVWDVACLITNPLIGLVKHPARALHPSSDGPSYPTVDPKDTYADLRGTFARHLPGARLRRRLGFRFTAVWTKTE